jgi:uncharacterized C2H2 Zn-finger protein
MKKEFCCNDMYYYTHFHCDEHNNIFKCPDCILIYEKQKRTYGIIIHDGGESFIKINYCPWCGATL